MAQKARLSLIEETVQLVSRQGKKTSTKGLAAFAQSLFGNVPPDDIAGESASNLAGAALALWHFLQARKAGQPKIRVYSPEQKKDGWASPHSVIEIVNDDMPFLVDSVTAAIAKEGIAVRLVIHPILAVMRDRAGRLQSLHAMSDRHDGARAESVMQVWIDEQPAEAHAHLADTLQRVLADVRAAVVDWRIMRQRARDLMRELETKPPPLPKSEVAEALALLDWLDDNHFTYLGYREYAFQGKGAKATSRIVPKSGLGLLRDDKVSIFDGLRNLSDMPPEVQHFIRRPELLRLTKANRRSSVHRDVYMDTVAIKTFSADGEVTGERLFTGLFTSTAYSAPLREIPLLRQKAQRVIERSGFSPTSHDGKALAHILETYPRDELFQASEQDLYRIALGILHLQERRRVALFVRRDPFERFISAMIFVPGDRFDTSLRLKLQEMIAKAYEGEIYSFNTHLGDQALARLHLIVKTRAGQLPKVNVDKLEAELAAATRSWSDGMQDALVAVYGEADGLLLAKRYAKAFPAAYREAFGPTIAVKDIRRLERTAQQGLALNFYKPLGAGPNDGVLSFKIYVQKEPIPLSDILPVLENLGLKVISEVPFAIDLPGQRLWMHDFALRLRQPSKLSLAEVRAKFHDVFARVWSGRMENDALNRLVLVAGFSSRQIIVLRAMIRYLRQAKIPFSQEYMESTLAANAHIALLLVELFEARFDPLRHKGRAAAEARVKAQIKAALEKVVNLDEDRILRRFLNLIEAMLRTNFYQPGDGRGPEAVGAEKRHLSFKLDSRHIDDLPLPRPYREIFVYSPQVEGVHLRFGPVARGGLRWSDRREDFRTEILGLVKAQQVKNAVIVPVGSKGGFVLKAPPPPSAGRDALQAEGIACYRTFLRGLLDLTDNLVQGKLHPPAQVVRHDGDDPYLVVAADKGTATFSDIANGVSADYGFWLGDAFASGGSAGYDHKAMAITARGGWEAVKRHFREIGKDIQSQEFTVAGVGDMSGDVFGNAMLLSQKIRLIAAFDHRHIFLDPGPDPTKSFKERQRMFKLPRSSWDDYDKKLISKGGGVFDRKLKAIALSSEARQALNLHKESVTPQELMRAILTAPVELLWFGGIGTYVKASHQSHADVGDRANDALRIDGRDLKAKVVGEGANLGMTQLGRVEYCLAGGRCNSDSIDNSAGVDCSDHEVNIKILLGDLEQRGKLKRTQRDKLLVKMTDEVAELVLRDNYLQTQAISVTQQLGHHLLDRLARYVRALEKAGQIDRQLEYLPDDEQLAERAAAKIGLTRPEIGTLLSYSKIVLNQALVQSDLPDDPALQAELFGYFPKPLQKTYADAIQRHRLKREIIATAVTNNLVNRVGVSFAYELGEKTGLSPVDVARAYLCARDLFDASKDWAAIEALDAKVPASLQAHLLAEVGRLVERGTIWLLRNAGQKLSIQTALKLYRPVIAEGTEHLDAVMAKHDRQALEARVAKLAAQGVPQELARRIGEAPWRSILLEIARIAAERKLKLKETAEAFFAVGHRLGFDALRHAAGKLSTDSGWDKLAISSLLEDLASQQATTTSAILASGRSKSLENALHLWSEERRPLIQRSEQLVAEINAAAAPSLAMLAVASRQLRSLVN